MKKTSVFPYLIKKVRHRIPMLLIMSTANVGSALFGVLFALGTKNVINSAINGNTDAFWQACIVQAGIILGILTCITLYRYLHDKLTAELDRDWKRDLLHGLLQGDYAKVSEYHSGELINRLNNDVRTVNDGLLQTLPGLLSMITRLSAVIIILYTLEPKITLVLAVLGVMVVLATGLARKKLKILHKAVSASEGKVSGFIQEALEKLLLVQAMDVQQEVERRTDVLLDERYRLQRKRRRVSLLHNTGVSALAYLSRFAALVWCAFCVLKGTLTFGDLTAITQLVTQLQGPLVNLSGIFPKYIAMTAACERLMEVDLLSDQQEQESMCDPWSVYETMQNLRAENLAFSYEEKQELVLKPSTFLIPKGSFVAVVGQSGIGKSTLLKLLLGIFRPLDGKLYLECTDRERILNRSTRKLFAYVPQGNLLFSGTLRDNLIITKPDATDEEIRQAVSVSCLDDVVSQLPEGLDTMLGENAQGLSEGQAQRLAIARAVLSGAPILLLDECTSALDAETERLVLQRLRELPDKTCIAVTHRPAALELADWKLEVTDGVIQAKRIEVVSR